jgi:hypothetical protein
MAAERVKELQELVAKLASKRSGFAMRRRRQQSEASAWRQTVTHYLPEPWLIARRAFEAKLTSAE